MNLNELRSLIVALDAAYERIESEYRAGGPATGDSGGAPWDSFYYQGAEPGRSNTMASDACGDHDGAAHALGGDDFSGSFTQEMSSWVRLASRSDTARGLLGVDRMDPGFGPMDAVGGMTSILPEGAADEVDLRLASTRDLIVPADGILGLWERTPRSDFNLWTKDRGVRPSNVADRYGEHLARLTGDARIAAPPRVGDCPAAKLLGSVVDGGVARYTPMGYSESWLDGQRIGADDSLWSTPSAASRFGMRDWGCGHDELVAKVSDAAKARYAARGEEWRRFLQGEGSRKRRELRPADPVAPGGVRARSLAAPSVGRATETTRSATPDAGVAKSMIGDVPTAKGPARVGATDPANPRGPAARTDAPEFQELRDRFAEAARERSSGGPSGRFGGGDPLGGERHSSVSVRVEIAGVDTSQVEVREIHGREAISQLFAFDLLVVCPADLELAVDDVLGSSCAIVFERGRADARRVSGMIAEIVDRQESESEWRSYRLHIVPRAWRSTLVSTQEVYLDTTVPDLILKKLALVGLDDAEMRVRGTYPMRELVVQYKETDQAFISRLAEHLGVCFFFEHGDDGDKLVFSDDNSGFRPIALQAGELGAVPFRTRGDQIDIFEFETRARAFPARYAEQDYNYRTPTVDLTGIYDEPTGFGGGNIEYGAHYRAPDEGTNFARLRAEEQVVKNRYSVGKSDVAELYPGGTFRMNGHPKLDGQELLVVEVEHHAIQPTKLHSGKSEPYVNRFRSVDASLPYRPPRITKRPRVSGVLTALVEPDPSGQVAESAVIDEEGRYTVLFYFDAADVAGRAKHSRPVRMVQAHSGPNYGIHFPLKPGIEVLIVFMDGDPDRPMIIGSVPNPITPTPVNKEVNLMNRIETASGLIIEMRDAVPPLVK